MAFEREELWTRANERLPWHEKLEGEDCIQKQVHELVFHLQLFSFYSLKSLVYFYISSCMKLKLYILEVLKLRETVSILNHN